MFNPFLHLILYLFLLSKNNFENSSILFISNNIFMILNRFELLILKINFFKNIILINFLIKIILKNKIAARTFPRSIFNFASMEFF